MGVEIKVAFIINKLYSLNSVTVAWRLTFCYTNTLRDDTFLQGYQFLVIFVNGSILLIFFFKVNIFLFFMKSDGVYNEHDLVLENGVFTMKKM